MAPRAGPCRVRSSGPALRAMELPYLQEIFGGVVRRHWHSPTPFPSGGVVRKFELPESEACAWRSKRLRLKTVPDNRNLRLNRGLLSCEWNACMLMRSEQLAIFERTAQAHFATSLRDFLRQAHSSVRVRLPSGVYLLQGITDGVLLELISRSIEKGRLYSLTWQSSLAAFVTLMFTAAPELRCRSSDPSNTDRSCHPPKPPRHPRLPVGYRSTLEEHSRNVRSRSVGRFAAGADRLMDHHAKLG